MPVVIVGDVPNTKAPLPVSSVIAEAKFALVGVTKNVPIPVANPDIPVDIGSPVQLVKTPETGVPNAGEVSVGLVVTVNTPEVDNTKPVPNPDAFVIALASVTFLLAGVPEGLSTVTIKSSLVGEVSAINSVILICPIFSPKL
jgi:hypothetical protein